jgi:hypothetical protein
MSMFGTRYRLRRGEHGLYQIEVTGRCYASDIAIIEANVTGTRPPGYGISGAPILGGW